MVKLTVKRRNKLRKNQFAIPDRRAYPIDTKNRAISALARVKQHGNSVEKNRVRRAVHRKYPKIKITGYKH